MTLRSRHSIYKGLIFISAGVGISLLLILGIMAKNGWFPSTDAVTGKRTGWFGKPLAKNAPSSWNPIAPDPTPPALSKEYIYAGSRLLAVEDSNASAVPPADLAIWRPSTGAWWVMSGSALGNYSNYYAFTWGNNTDPDKPVPGDYDGDGKTDFAIYRPSTNTWWISKSSDNTYYYVTFGASGDLPAQADFDGDGKTDIAIFRPSTGYWYILQSSTNSTVGGPFGSNGDTPAPADFDGDGKADSAVWRDSNNTFYSQNSSNLTTSSFAFSVSASKAVPADYDGDGKDDYAIRQSGSNNWLIHNSHSGTTDTIAWQNAGDVAVQNDYDGDGKCDIAVWRDSTGYWYIRPSSGPSTTRSVQWGMSGDTPEPAYFRR